VIVIKTEISNVTGRMIQSRLIVHQ
jgi:hypothetical protein